MKEKVMRMGKNWLAFILAVAMIVSAQGMPVMSEIKAAERELPKNPVHHCTKEDDGSDYTEWSYVYFGSYPQGEVTGSALTSAITGASYDANGDAVVNGTKYRRISKSDTNNDEYFGDGTYRYFRWERIKWRVLRVSDSTIFVMADEGLDCKCYNDIQGSVTWETCTLRNWLNNDFYGTAFSVGEQGAIVSQTVVNEDNPDFKTEGGNDTTDKVYLLSLSEAANPDYGFCEDAVTYSGSRKVKPSDYAHARGAEISTDSDSAGNCSYWWLRSPAYATSDASVGVCIGTASSYGTPVHWNNQACVPVLHISLTSEFWSMTNEELKWSGESETDIPKVTPQESTLKGKITAKSKAFTVKWKKQSDVSGYQIQYSTNKKFKKKGTKTKTVKKPNATKLTVKKLKAGKKYYVRVRTYKTVDGTDYYSEWSKSKSVKTKN